MNLLTRMVVILGSAISVGFGIWHFFVPTIWRWYSFIDENATELITAIRAINAFFSLSLVLFGLVNILLMYGNKSNPYSIIVILSATCVLWVTRVAFQLMYPQGSQFPGLQYGMLFVFVIVTLCYLLPLLNLLSQSAGQLMIT